MRKKILNYIIIFASFTVLCLNTVIAYSVNSSNNPGTSYSSGSSSLSSPTIWPSPYLKVIRIRIFRDGVALANFNGYYSIVNDQSKCYKDVEARLCTTGGYNYANVSSASDSSCTGTSSKISLGCIAGDNFDSSWDVHSSNGTYVNNYMIENNYSNLKSILLGMGYNDYTYMPEDIVIVEPATLIKCDGVYYFGTSTSMMRQDISFSGDSCGTPLTDDFYSGYTFSGLFRSMSIAFKTVDSECKNDSYSGCGYFQYNVSGLGYTPYGKLPVKITNSVTNAVITSSSAQFELYNSSNCTGSVVSTKTTSSGVTEFDNLPTGTYSIKNTNSPTGYKSREGECVVTSITVSTGTNAEQNIKFEPTCQTRLDESNKTVGELLAIYKDFPNNRNLLNFSNPSCSAPRPDDCSDSVTSNLDLGCLYAKKNITNFNENNLSCYTGDAYTDEYGNYKAFCIDTFELENSFGFNDTGVKKFYGSSGRFLIKKTVDNVIQFYREKNELSQVDGPYIAAAILGKRCYVLEGEDVEVDTNNIPNFRLYFGDNNSNGKPEQLKAYTDSYEEWDEATNGFNIYETKKLFAFEMNSIYLEKLTGKLTKKPRGAKTFTGVVSPFNKESGSIPCKFKIGTEEVSLSNKCKYEVSQDIVKYPPKKPSGDLDLEFRIINTVNPFLDENGNVRDTNTNWCDPNIEGEEKCSATNSLVVQNIINATNSFGRNASGEQQEPLYTITLTAADIKIIRDYNKDNYYDTVEIYCNSSGKCFNAFLYGLMNGELKKYEDDEEVDSYGLLSSLNSTKSLKEEPNGEEFEETEEVDEETDDFSGEETEEDDSQETNNSTEEEPTVQETPQGGGSSGTVINYPGETTRRNYFASSLARGHHIVSINYGIPDIKSCVSIRNGVRTSEYIGPAKRRCEVELTTFAKMPSHWRDPAKYYYYTLEMTLIDGTIYRDCVRVKVKNIGLVAKREVDFVSSSRCN